MRTIYLDMDGVIANFFKSFADKNNVDHWKSIKEKDKALNELVGTDFFYHIPTFGNESRNIVNFVKGITEGNWGICSSPLRGDHNNSAYWKRRWLEDRGFKRWEQAGGIGIRFQCDKDDVVEYLFEEIKNVY